MVGASGFSDMGHDPNKGHLRVAVDVRFQGFIPTRGVDQGLFLSIFSHAPPEAGDGDRPHTIRQVLDPAMPDLAIH